jgi:hypothetical protein
LEEHFISGIDDVQGSSCSLEELFQVFQLKCGLALPLLTQGLVEFIEV